MAKRRHDDRRHEPRPDGVVRWADDKALRREDGRVNRDSYGSLDRLGTPRALTLRIDPFSDRPSERGPVSYGRKPETQVRDMRVAERMAATLRDAPTESDHKRTWRDPVLREAPPRKPKEVLKDFHCKSRPHEVTRKKHGSGKKFVPWCR